ncbi:hypothetical protein, partial [Mycobacterium sp. E2989]|uniref:hypothetical protein n=1 Tax=Mycobacterium sp. E2989 TaxID=1834140 RepID=UPI000B23182E
MDTVPAACCSPTGQFGVYDYVDGMERLLQAVQELSLARSTNVAPSQPVSSRAEVRTMRWISG